MHAGHSIVSASDNDQIPKSCTNEWPPLLKRHCQEIMQNVNMEMLTPHLIQNELITRSEYERIAGVSPWEQSQYFVLKVLPSKGQGGFERFLKCLQEEKEHLGHQDLVQLLTKS